MASPQDIAVAFTDAFAGRYAAADSAGLGSLYGEDSIISFDGGSVKGRAALVGAMGPRMTPGPVRTRWVTRDAQVAPGGFLVVFTVGESERPAGKFTQAFTLFQAPGGAGMYIRTDACRFGPGATAFSTGLDPTGMGAAFAQQYYQVYASNRAALAGIYRDSSQLRFEEKSLAGPAAIMEQVMAMPTGRQQLDTLDVQPISADTVIILVTGRVILEGQDNALGFGQCFVVSAAGGSPFVTNEFYRFSIG